MAPETVAHVIATIHKHWSVATDVEITLEANPTSVEQEKFEAFAQAGVNRVSLGIQSLQPEALTFLGRQHSVEDAKNALSVAQSVFQRTSFDLIYARPDQTLAAWEDELNDALTLAKAGHLSLYQLTIEPGTAFETMYKRKEFFIPDDDDGAALYELTKQITAAHGFSRYEVSNYAKAGEESRHNLAYWRYTDYAGIGPGAHGRLTLDGEKFATRAHRAPGIWLQKVDADGHGYHPFERLSRTDRAWECVLMGLRLKEGLSLEKLEEEAAASWEEILNKQKILDFQTQGYMVLEPDRLALTKTGFQRLEGLLQDIVI
jgi:oxygen-independent coproporphyrinogen-3 oxidase